MRRKPTFPFGGVLKGCAVQPQARVRPAFYPTDTGKPYGVVLTPILPETLAAASCLSGAAAAL